MCSTLLCRCQEGPVVCNVCVRCPATKRPKSINRKRLSWKCFFSSVRHRSWVFLCLNIYIYISFMESSDVCFAGYSTGISDANIKNTYTHICHHRVAVPRVLGFPLFIYLFRHLFTFRPKPAARRGGHRGGHRVAQSPIDDEVLHNGRWKLRGDRGQGIHLGTGRPRTWGPERGVFACSCASHATACGVGQEATTNGP